MAVQTLQITLTANNQQALAALQQTVTSLNGVSAAAGRAGGATGRMGRDFTGLSRVIQDLPYGFNAIANNLTNILPAAGALGLGISALVAGLQFAQLGFGAWTRGLSGTKEATEAAKKANDEYAASLAKEQVSLSVLYTTATNANLPLSARNAAVKELMDNFGEYFAGYSKESIMLGQAGDAYKKLSAAIIMVAKAKAAQNLMTEKQTELFKLEKEEADAVTQSNLDLNAISEGKQVKGQFYIPNKIGKAAARENVNEQLLKTITESVAKRTAIQKEIDDLNKKVQENTIAPFKEDKTGATGAVEKINGALENYMNNLNAILPLLERFNAQNDRLNFGQKGGQQTEMLAPQRNTGTQDLQNLQLQVTANNTLNNALAVRNSEQMKYEEQLRESQAAALTNNLMNSVTGLFTAMQNGASLGEAFGNMFKQIAIDIAKAAVQAAIFQAILMALPGGGGGLSFGQGFTGVFKKLLGFSEGGTVSGPQSGYPVMLHGTEHIVRPDQMKQIIASASQMGGSNSSRVMVEGIIRGNDIFLSQQRTGTFRSLTT
jgi:hypothetical protein